MGTRAAPSYANLFMARKIDPKIIELATTLANGSNPILFFKRFLDDVFMVYRGPIDALHHFLTELNNIHPTIKFTMSHAFPNLKETQHLCECDQSITLPFLDTSCKIINGKIIVDLYRKETDRNQYLLTTSCHPAHVTKNIPFSLALRIVRICSLSEDRDKRLEELKSLLLTRNYKSKLIDAAIQKAIQIPRTEALKKVIKSKNSPRPVFAITFDPRLPSISGIVQRHWRTMVKDPHLSEAFPLPPLVSYRRPPNVRDKAIRSKVPPPPPLRPKRVIAGMKKCNRCPICPFVKEGKAVKAKASKAIVAINKPVDCQTNNAIYCISCKRCPQQYIGESDRTLQTRFSEHRGYVTNQKLQKATGYHFNLPGHSLADMEVTILEKIFNPDPQFRKAREKMFINEFNTKHKGLNRNS